jgi:hypothetical protein
MFFILSNGSWIIEGVYYLCRLKYYFGGGYNQKKPETSASLKSYKPTTAQELPKFAGIKTYMRLPHCQTTQGIDFAVVGVPWDGATSYRTGQRMAPDAIRRVSMVLRPYNLALDVGIFEGLNFVGFDVVEFLPDYDPADLTALMAANAIYEFLSLISRYKKDSKKLNSPHPHQSSTTRYSFLLPLEVFLFRTIIFQRPLQMENST